MEGVFPMSADRLLIWLFALLFAAPLPAIAANAEEPRAELKISGYGFLGNRRLKNALEILDAERKRTFFNANFIEDAALILTSQLASEGFLEPDLRVDLTLPDGREVTYTAAELLNEPLTRPFRAQRVHFRIRKGVLYHFRHIEFTGLEAIREREGRAFFIETGGLIRLKRNRIFSPNRLERGVSSLTESLERLGYRNAVVRAEELERDDRTGGVSVRFHVNEGQQFIARSVRQEVFVEGDPNPGEVRTNHPAAPFSRLWEQDFMQGIRTNYFARGYPDAAVEMRTERREPDDEVVQMDLLATVRTGPRIRVGDVRFEGNERTRESVLQRRVRLDDDDWLNRLQAERGRARLARLGIFRSVELTYDEVDEETRDVVYQLQEGKRIDVSLLFGYGSYELLRGGVELEQFNVFGRAHHSRLRVTQSFKSSSANYMYTMPELLGEDLDVFLNASGLRREEVSFTRTEYGGGAGVRKYLRGIDTDVGLRYNYEVLRASEVPFDITPEGVRNPAVSALIADLRHDRRDNPLYPQRGYNVFTSFEAATDYLGGDVNYQRFDLAFSHHWPITRGNWIHVGLSHGLVSTIGGPSEDLPFNRRFFPGGESSLRGYPEGEASPRNDEGRFVGAETFLLGNIEFEQALTMRWSLVVFADGLGFAHDLSDYPVDEALFSAGGGLRWKTFIGPVRIEYGHNLNPRRGDPSGTLHFSLGFPF